MGIRDVTEAIAPPITENVDHLVTVDGLVKQFGDFVAVNNISFQVRTGEIFGFLGPNGAGKSTTIKTICTLLSPTSGRVTVAGHDVTREPDQVRQAIGIVFQDNSLDSGLTGQENLEFHCMMYHIPREERAKRIKDVLALMELTDFKNQLIKTYSGGMRRRLEIARGLLHEPRLLILDEPTVGLDPQTRSYIWQYVRQLRQQHDTTVFMTTHYMDEAENCDRIAIIDHGQIIALDTPGALKHNISDDMIDLEASDAPAASKLIESKLNLKGQVDGKRLTVSTQDAEHTVPHLIEALVNAGIRVEALQVRRASLEDVFIKLTGNRIRLEEGGKDERRLTQRRFGRI